MHEYIHIIISNVRRFIRLCFLIIVVELHISVIKEFYHFKTCIRIFTLNIYIWKSRQFASISEILILKLT